MDSKEMVKVIYAALDEKKAEDITIIDIHDITVIADYFVVASANNTNQLASLQDNVEEKLYKLGALEGKIEGNRSSTWVLMDYNDVIIHLFSKEDRLFYNLERIWQDGVTVDIDSLN